MRVISGERGGGSGESTGGEGELREVAPLPWKKLKEKGYKRVLALSRLGILAARHRIKVTGWEKIEGWLPFSLQNLGATQKFPG